MGVRGFVLSSQRQLFPCASGRKVHSPAPYFILFKFLRAHSVVPGKPRSAPERGDCAGKEYGGAAPGDGGLLRTAGAGPRCSPFAPLPRFAGLGSSVCRPFRYCRARAERPEQLHGAARLSARPALPSGAIREIMVRPAGRIKERCGPGQRSG